MTDTELVNGNRDYYQMVTEESMQLKLLNEINGLFHVFCRVNGVNLNNPLTQEMVDKIRAVIDSIEDERDEDARHIQETLDDARNSGNP